MQPKGQENDTIYCDARIYFTSKPSFVQNRPALRK